MVFTGPPASVGVYVLNFRQTSLKKFQSYLLVLTVRRRQTTKFGIFSFSALVERGELIFSMIPKLFVTYFYLTRFVNPSATVPLAALILPVIDCFLIVIEVRVKINTHAVGFEILKNANLIFKNWLGSGFFQSFIIKIFMKNVNESMVIFRVNS